MREVILLRTHYFDGSVAEMADLFTRQSGRDVLVVCDETKGVVDIPAPHVKVSLNRAGLEAEGIHVPDNFGWRCGDYAYFAARRAHPEYESYWLIETDVVLKFDAIATFFDHFPGADEVDLLAPGFFKSLPRWPWHQSMVPFSDNVHGCMFPITRLSGRAIDHVMAGRAAISPRFLELNAASDVPLSWPNDEAFVATRLVEGNFVCRGLNSFGRRFHAKETFWIGPPASRKHVLALPNDSMIHHPVHGGASFHRKMKNHISTRVHATAEVADIEALFGDAFFARIAAECGQEGVDTLRAHLKAQMLRRKPRA